MADEPEIEETYQMERRREYTFIQPRLYDYRLEFNQQTTDAITGDDLPLAVRIVNLSDSDAIDVELTREAAIDLAKAILAEAGTTFESWEMDTFLQPQRTI